MGQLAYVFPGQGAQQPGMGKALYRNSPAARKLMDRAETLMPGLLEACFEGPMERLTQTDIAQPAIFTISLACAKAAAESGIKPQAVAGFSLGEWSAVKFAGMLSFETAFELVRNRGAWMQECADKNPGGMAAVLRMEGEELLEILKSHPDVWPVNHNTKEQTVVAARQADLENFLSDMKERGKRCMKLNVAGAFHSPLMKEASQHLGEALKNLDILPPALPVYSNLTAAPYTQASAAATLASQCSENVRWVDSIRAMADSGIDSFLELGPGRVLCGLISKILPEARVYQAEDMDGIQAAIKQMGEEA